MKCLSHRPPHGRALITALTLGTALLLASAGTLADPATGEQITFSPAQIEALGVELAHPLAVTDAAGPVVAARVVIPPGQDTVVAAPLDGLVDTLLVAEGQTVTAGQALATLRSPGLLALQRGYLEALARDRLARQQLSRDEALFKDGIIAERRLLETRSTAAEARAAANAQRQALELSGIAESDLEALARSGRIGSSLTLRAPRDGVILEVMAVTGQRLEASAPVLRLAALDRLWLELHLPAEQLDGLAVDDAVVTADGQARGRVRLIGGTVSSGDETVLVRVEVDSGTEHLRPGQFVQARVLGLQGTDSFSIPASAVVRRADGDYVFVRRAAGFAAVAVERIAADGERLVVRGPLTLDDAIAVSGAAAIKGAWMGIGGGE
ncbi:MAG TPA: efflux RND transporter periplasmic adaptor subunit [Thioalkalivibrio sp.]|nr:efflux RND transporter periplasmic adaptor subunit [Thioalkalivibrio sp.]